MAYPSDLLVLLFALCATSFLGYRYLGVADAWLAASAVIGAVGAGAARAAQLDRGAAFIMGFYLAGATLVSGAAGGSNPLICAALGAAALLVLAALLRHGSRATRNWACGLLLTTWLGSMIVFYARLDGPTTRPGQGSARAQARGAESQPEMFLPLELDDTGRRAVLWSVIDSDQKDDSQSLWTLDVTDGKVRRVHQGYSLPLVEWSPDGGRFTFTSADRPWGDEEPVPFGVWVAPFDGPGKPRLPVPATGSWMYPSWSKQGNKLGAWLLPDAPDLGQAGTLRDMPRSFVLDPDGGEPKEILVRGCRLSLLSAWEAQAEGALVMTEHGIYRVRPEGKPKRLVAAGEAPLDPFPMPIQQGVSPDGRNIAYLDLTFKSGDIERIDLKVIDSDGRRRGGIDKIVRLAMGWSADGKVLAAATEGRGGELLLNLYDPETRKVRVLRTGLKRTDPVFPVRLSVSRDGAYVAINGPLAEGAMISVAVCDVASGKTTVLPSCHNHLVSGWRTDGWLVVSDTQTVSAVSPDGQRRPIYVPSSAGGESSLHSFEDWLTTEASTPMEKMLTVGGILDAWRLR